MGIFSREKATRYVSVGVFSNETENEMNINLEMTCEQIILDSGHEVELLAEDNEQCFPLTFLYLAEGLQIYPKYDTPQWLIRYKGKEYVPGHPTKLSELE